MTLDTSYCKQLIIGLPNTGKTTFLAALWEVVNSGDVPESMKLTELHGDRDHLNKIRGNWLACRPLERTGISAEKLVSMRLVEAGSGKITEVYFPDMSGESFNLQWKDRKWTKEYDNLVCEASGVLLFIHPEEVKEPVRIDMAEPIVAELSKDSEESGTPEEANIVEWEPDFASTQVKLVELLQFFAFQLHSLPIFPVAVIISAWDLVSQGQGPPDKWLAARLPLFNQYLRANPEFFPARTYGVSAQGGDIKKDSDRLLHKLRPAHRIIVDGPDCAPHDITAPVKWIMSK